ncbi:MAG: hypothetical protein RLZZ15_1563 [Verrucomicrobiota bacterium]|jgi:hypothetical protein
MKTEDQAWRELQDHAAAQLRGGFATRVLRAVHGPDARAWDHLQRHAGAQLAPGFATRVLLALRVARAGVPSLFSQFAVGAATGAACLVAVVYFHSRSTRLQEERNLADWQRLAAEVQDLDATL